MTITTSSSERVITPAHTMVEEGSIDQDELAIVQGQKKDRRDGDEPHCPCGPWNSRLTSALCQKTLCPGPARASYGGNTVCEGPGRQVRAAQSDNRSVLAGFADPTEIYMADKDQPILAGAMGAGCSHLWTNDARHFGSFYGRTIDSVLVSFQASCWSRNYWIAVGRLYFSP